MTTGGKIFRWAVRLGVLALALCLVLGGPIPSVLARGLPGLSPLVALTSSIAQRRWVVGLTWLAPPLAVLALGFWKGRFFCRWVCPAGTVYSIPARWSLRKPLLRVRLNAFVFWTMVFGSLAGVPLLASLDPLSTFNRLTPWLTGTATVVSLIPGLLLPLFLLLGVLQPKIWCTHLCPLGYLFELCHSTRRQGLKEPFRRARRQILAGLAVGLPTAALTRTFLLSRSGRQGLPILPPGAKDPEAFAAACTRCYACLNVCPMKIIRVASPADRAVGQWFQPEIAFFDSEDNPDLGYCEEPCNNCSRVCAAGALTPLTFQEKRRRQIGIAEVIRSACLAWEKGEHCMICQEHCSYFAVEMKPCEKGVPAPVVIEDVCRGCGTCQSKCPGVAGRKGIIVRGVKEQKAARDDPGGKGAATGAATRPAASGPATQPAKHLP